MPPRKNNFPLRAHRGRMSQKSPPETMTWIKALPVLVVCVVFDALRFIFEQFWFFGPALAALWCGSKVEGVWLVGKLLVAGCVAAASVVGFYASPAIMGFGVIMAMAVGLIGWMTIGLILILFNRRILEENALQFASSLLVSEVPFVGSIPAITIIVGKMYRTQIKVEKAALKKYWTDHAAALQEERQQQAAELMYARNMQIAQIQEQEAIDDEMYAEEENGEQEIHEDVRGAT